MRKQHLVHVLLAALLSSSSVFAQTAPAPGAAPAAEAAPAAPASPFTANVMLASDYRFRGISQTFKKPAIQGGMDYANENGFYIGTWASNVSHYMYQNGNMEWDFYAGWKKEVVKDLTIDLGALYYYYPGAHTLPTAVTSNTAKYDNGEIYFGLSYKWFSGKISYAVTDYFGLNNTQVFGVDNPGAASFPSCGLNSDGSAATTATTGNCYTSAPGGSKGTTYVDLNLNIPIAEGLTLGLHGGHTKVKNWSNHSYSDGKISLTKDMGSGWSISAAAIGTNAKREWYRYTSTGFVAPPGAALPGQEIKDTSGSTLVLSIGRVF